MDQIKIGMFIADCRKTKGWTQEKLAGQLGITDKAVSKWETGKSMPDLSLFTPLCGLLSISLNELLAGERIPDDKLREKSNEILMDVITDFLGSDISLRRQAQLQNNSKTLLKLTDVQKRYKTQATETRAVNKINLELSKGSFTAIMGASGCGKTTLLNLIATIDKPTGGTIELDGQDMNGLSEKELAAFRRKHLGFIFQDYNLLDTLTVYENISLSLTVNKEPSDKIRRTILNLAEALNITGVLNKFPCEISGGQRQRCACARAISLNPSLILADEPTGALDSQSARQLLHTLTMLCRDYGSTILMVTHDALSASYCDRIYFMQDGEIKAALDRTQETKQAFFAKILETMTQMEGNNYDVS